VSKSREIFAKKRLTPGQLRSVAERRYHDALCLLNSGDNERATGAMYMGGFTIECLLKASLLDRHRNLQSPVDPAKLSATDREVLQLLYSHDLDDMLLLLPEVEKKLRSVQQSGSGSLWRHFREVCEEWTVYARYSPKQASTGEARRFIDTITEVKTWLRGL
jgi:hypothetical protein